MAFFQELLLIKSLNWQLFFLHFEFCIKGYIVRIFFGNDSRILIALWPMIAVWACRSGSKASVASSETALSPKPRAGMRIERLKGTAENLTAD
jgi:hypothetical protein